MPSLYENLPDSPGVYLMKSAVGKLLYVGKAANLKRRVSSYFTRSLDPRIEKLVSEIAKIDFIKTDTAIEALILEADLIKRHKPPFNIKDKDDKSFLFAEITSEKFPRVLLVRGKSEERGMRFGPFTSPSQARVALRIIRKIFPYSIHPAEKIGAYKKPCFEAEIGLCPGTCIGAITRKEYLKNIRNIKMFFSGKKEKIISGLEKEMKEAAGKLEFERAAAVKNKIFSLKHIHDIALITSESAWDEGGLRIEGYDISNISGDAAVGSLVVFKGDKPLSEDYRLFKIRSVTGANDPAMMKEVISRRLTHSWPLPDLILVDGGITQIEAARAALDEAGISLPVAGMAKGPERKRTDISGDPIPEGIDLKTLIAVRDEAHRFAIGYHRRLRSKNLFAS